MVGTGKGAENGILIKSGQALEAAYQLDTIVLDKTGTITIGRPSLTDLLSLSDFNRSDLLQLIASAEQHSELLKERIARTLFAAQYRNASSTLSDSQK